MVWPSKAVFHLGGVIGLSGIRILHCVFVVVVVVVVIIIIIILLLLSWISWTSLPSVLNIYCSYNERSSWNWDVTAEWAGQQRTLFGRSRHGRLRLRPLGRIASRKCQTGSRGCRLSAKSGARAKSNAIIRDVKSYAIERCSMLDLGASSERFSGLQ